VLLSAKPKSFFLKRKCNVSTGNITDEMVQEYLEHHRNPSNGDTGNIILE